MQYKHLQARPRVLVNLLSGTSISGVIVSTRGPLLTIKGAVIHTAESGDTPADGEIAVDKTQVDFIQMM